MLYYALLFLLHICCYYIPILTIILLYNLIEYVINILHFLAHFIIQAFIKNIS